jgi:AcrR family transcriptional regulator
MNANTKRKSSAKKRALVRGEPVVRKSMAAVLDELGRVGYGALRIEDVAARARVSKTTVYRRWPTKESLVRAALLALGKSHGIKEFPDTGSLQGDMMAALRSFVRMANSVEARTIIRMIAASQPDSKIRAILESIQETQEAGPRAMMERARKRGEFRPEVDIELVGQVMMAACDRLVLRSARVDGRLMAKILDLLLFGALDRRGARRRQQKVKPASHGRNP